MSRTIEPELLDSLPPGHPDALHNRRDLRLINLAMGNHRWIARTLSTLVRPGERVLELGAGTGELVRRLSATGLEVAGLDRWPAPPDVAECWHVADLRTFTGYDRFPVIVGNLIFHQFEDQELAALGALLARTTRVFVACEPVRSRRSQLLFRWFAPLFGVNYVSRHDAHVSIAAGFRGTELANALGWTPEEWQVECSVAPIGAYHLVAVRRS